jgi:hypothetical protein
VRRGDDDQRRRKTALNFDRTASLFGLFGSVWFYGGGDLLDCVRRKLPVLTSVFVFKCSFCLSFNILRWCWLSDIYGSRS